MNWYYIQFIAAFLIAQALLLSVAVYFYQKKRNISWWIAFKTYVIAEVGFYIIGILGAILILFLLSEYIDLSLNRHVLITKSDLDWHEKLVRYFKSFSAVIGGFVQTLAFIYRRKGKDAINKIADKLQP